MKGMDLKHVALTRKKTRKKIKAYGKCLLGILFMGCLMVLPRYKIQTLFDVFKEHVSDDNVLKGICVVFVCEISFHS